MDWYADAADRTAGVALRREVAEYLVRHADSEAKDTDLHAAELAFVEVFANAVEHASGPVWVSLNWQGRRPVLSVHDLGSGFSIDPNGLRPPDGLSEGGRGLFLVAHLTDELRVAAKRAGGARVTVTLPVVRRVERSHTPRTPLPDALPHPSEAREGGMFGRESFLRALAVQLAQNVERLHGPDRAEEAVTQVGTDVGSRMEEAYRRARELTGRLSTEQMADLFVRLKAGIGGDFYVIEATDERIVLGNRACPFGEVVQQSPALCRMTSSVFGGIAARNRDGTAQVQLEERIAVGDPECRVTVWLQPEQPESGTVHHYATPNLREAVS